MKLIWKVNTLGFSTTLCNRLLDLLTSRPQTVQIGNHTSSTSVPNTGVPQGCVFGPRLFTLYTHDSTPRHQTNTIMKCEDSATTTGSITNYNESSYQGEINNQTEMCTENNLLLNVSEDQGADCWFQKKKRQRYRPCLHQWGWGGSGGNQHQSEPFMVIAHHHLGIKKNKAQKMLYLRKHLILVNFYRGALGSILAGNITNCPGLSTAMPTDSGAKSIPQAQLKTHKVVLNTPQFRFSHSTTTTCILLYNHVLYNTLNLYCRVKQVVADSKLSFRFQHLACHVLSSVCSDILWYDLIYNHLKRRKDLISPSRSTRRILIFFDHDAEAKLDSHTATVQWWWLK